MKKLKFTEISDILEKIVDQETLAFTIACLGNICSEKSEHILTTWQDEHTAKNWDRVCIQLARLALSTEKLGI